MQTFERVVSGFVPSIWHSRIGANPQLSTVFSLLTIPLSIDIYKPAVAMRRIPTLFEIILAAALTFVGVYLLYQGYFDKSAAGNGLVLIGGAVCFMTGVATLIPAVRALLWHRRMLRRMD